MEVDILMSTKQQFSEVTMRGVYKVYRSLEVLRDVSFDIPRGKFTCMVGPSGSGKSTIVNILAGYIEPDGGTTLLDGKPPGPPGAERIVVFQETALLPWRTLMENTLFGPTLQGLDKEESRKRAQALIDKSALTGFENKYPGQLSGGMQRRAELIRALINEPQIMFMDEPLRGLDAMTREIMQDYIIKMYEESGVTVLFITSELDEAIYLGDTVYFLTKPPGHVKYKMDIDLPRPRKNDVLISKKFFEYKAEAIKIALEERENV